MHITKKLDTSYSTEFPNIEVWEKGGSFRREGKKEGVLRDAFLLPTLLSLGLARSPFTRRPRGGGRRSQELQDFAKFSWRLVSMLVLEICPNFVVEAAPNEKSWFLARNFEAVFQVASHLLPREQEVRADFLQKLSFLF